MNEGLTEHEWALLLRAMNRVGQRAPAVPLPDANKIRASALAAYRHQGVAVSEEAVAQAVEEELVQWRSRPAPRSPSLALPSLPSRALWRWSQSWKVVPADENLLGSRPSVAKGGAVRRWEHALAPYAQHVPQSDEELEARLIHAAKFQLGRWRTSAWACWGWLLVGGVTGGGLAWWGAPVAGIAWFALNAYLGARSLLKAVDAQAKLALIGQALEDLAAHRWDSTELALALRGTGLLVLGALRPVSHEDSAWQTLRRQVRGLPGLTLRTTAWERTGALRENDLRVLEKTVALMKEHPTRQLMQRLADKARKTVAPLFWGR
jgi:hypothetical protein